MQKFSILPIDLSVETGDITPSLKLKRSELEAKCVCVPPAAVQLSPRDVVRVRPPHPSRGRAR